MLRRVLQTRHLKLSLIPAVITETDTVTIIIGTPVDRLLSPEFELMRKMIDSYMPFFKDGQLLILHSTVYPGTTEKLHNWFRERGKRVELVFCQERVIEGYAIKELEELPQIISAISKEGLRRYRELFSLFTEKILVLTPIEAELAKPFTNVWRSVKFATANQFFMIANDHGVDFYRIYRAMTYKYERAKDLPQPGFTAGPYFFKEAMQLIDDWRKSLS